MSRIVPNTLATWLQQPDDRMYASYLCLIKEIEDISSVNKQQEGSPGYLVAVL
jgi:hypothetical protein